MLCLLLACFVDALLISLNSLSLETVLAESVVFRKNAPFQLIAALFSLLLSIIIFPILLTMLIPDGFSSKT